jgi:hypothetical protein
MSVTVRQKKKGNKPFLVLLMRSFRLDWLGSRD